MTKLLTSLLGVTAVVATAGACGSDTDVATPDDLEQARARHYRIAAVTLPTSTMHAGVLAFDLDRDREPDNQLGLVHSALVQLSPPFAVMPTIETALARDVEWSLVVYDHAETNELLAVHLARDAEDLAYFEPAYALADGRFEGDLARLPLGTFSDALGGSGPGWADVQRLRVRIDRIDDTSVEARIGVAVTRDDVMLTALPNLARYFTARLAANDSQFAEEADVDDDGVVSTREMADSSYTRTLIAPDLDIDGVEALSIGFGVSGSR